MRVVICGGGVIGAALAYFLSLRGGHAIVVERSGVACAASGKSGGFLALDWCDGSPLGPLAQRSYELHAELAAGLGRDWGYRRLDTFAVASRAEGAVFGRRRLDGPDWLGDGAAVRARLGSPETTAQVDPAAFSCAVMEAALGLGARLIEGCVTGIALSPDGSVARAVEVDGEALDADAVVVAMGPWSVLAARWLPMPAVYGLKGHSVVLRPDRPIPPHALFVEHEADDGRVYSPEVYPRPDGTTYVCGLSAEVALPLDPARVAPEAGAIEKLRGMIARFAPEVARGRLLAAQACFRPLAEDGLPLLGPIPGVARAYVATGHSCWGILNAPASGEAMAELILEGAARKVDLSAFDPGRLEPVDLSRIAVRSA